MLLLVHTNPVLQNFLLATLFHNGGIAILLSALSALYQMTFAGFFVHLNSIPPVLRWLQWLCPLKYTLEALSVNEVGSGLMIQDNLQGVPVDVSASLIMNLVRQFFFLLSGMLHGLPNAQATVCLSSFLDLDPIITTGMFSCYLHSSQGSGLASSVSFGSKFGRDGSVDITVWALRVDLFFAASVDYIHVFIIFELYRTTIFV
jgi:hypothetical protein